MSIACRCMAHSTSSGRMVGPGTAMISRPDRTDIAVILPIPPCARGLRGARRAPCPFRGFGPKIKPCATAARMRADRECGIAALRTFLKLTLRSPVDLQLCPPMLVMVSARWRSGYAGTVQGPTAWFKSKPGLRYFRACRPRYRQVGCVSVGLLSVAFLSIALLLIALLLIARLLIVRISIRNQKAGHLDVEASPDPVRLQIDHPGHGDGPLMGAQPHLMGHEFFLVTMLALAEIEHLVAVIAALRQQVIEQLIPRRQRPIAEVVGRHHVVEAAAADKAEMCRGDLLAAYQGGEVADPSEPVWRR